MVPGFSGSLVSEYFVETTLRETFAGRLGEQARDAARRQIVRARRDAASRLGPVHSARTVFDTAAAPLLSALGFEPIIEKAGGGGLLARLAGDAGSPVLLVTGWGQPLDACWRAALSMVLASGAPWCFCTNGRTLRLVDARRALSRSFVEFELDAALEDEAAFAALWGMCRRESFVAPSLIGELVQAASRHAAGVCRSLRIGVLEAIGETMNGFARARPAGSLQGAWLDAAHEQALTIVYRVLFLLFAESRELVPLWHPIYRQNYSVEALRDLAERPGRATGIWEALQAMSRLAHSGCRAGSLRVTPFNGRLFAPSATPLGESRVDDESVRRVVLALSTLPGRRDAARARVVYRDLGVEQLGAVYESVLDYRPRVAGRSVSLVAGRGVRKATGTFYTPRALTTFLVRATLSPLVTHATPSAILSLRIVDPAMGSGAFLVAACRFLARAYESALVEHTGLEASDISEEDRRGFRRMVAQRCLYGVDRNPMAVQLARLSLWLCTLSPERPLTFLDHHLVAGDSLVGASPEDVRRAPPGTSGGGHRRPEALLPMFDDEAGLALRAVVPPRLRVASQPDDSLASVREKERILAEISGAGSPVSRWKAVADLWCSVAFRADARPADAGVFFAVADELLRARRSLPEPIVASWLAAARECAAARRFFHWMLEFPEVFVHPDGGPREDAGFDAVLGNPPWDMVRADNESGATAGEARDEARRLHRFARQSGLYRFQGDGHGNLFQMFVERSWRLARRGGRIGLVVPWGLAADQGCANLRRMLFDHCAVDRVIGFENSGGIFPIHRSVRFVLLTATTGGRTLEIPCSLGHRRADALESVAEPAALRIPRALLERLSPEALSLPDVRSAMDLSLLEKLSTAAPALGARAGWNVEFGREMNATDDANLFVEGSQGLAVLEGKHVEPFAVKGMTGARRLPVAVARSLPGWRAWSRPRLAYRDVASATNRLTLIAAIVPGGAVTVHTLFCLKTDLPRQDQDFLCGILNSFVANYLVRLRVTTHVTAGIVSRLPVPRPPEDSPLRRLIAALSRRLGCTRRPERSPHYPLLQAAVARLYGLTGSELDYILGTFPLIEPATRELAGRAFKESDERLMDDPGGELFDRNQDASQERGEHGSGEGGEEPVAGQEVFDDRGGDPH